MLSVGRLTYHSGDKHDAMLAGNKLVAVTQVPASLCAIKTLALYPFLPLKNICVFFVQNKVTMERMCLPEYVHVSSAITFGSGVFIY
jgi:hypothetical protein